MTSKILLTSLLLLSATISYADQLTSDNRSETSSSEPTLEEIDRRIKKAKEYLEKLPEEIASTKREFQVLAEKGNRATIMVTRYLSFSKKCANSELDGIGEDMCRFASKSDLGTLIKNKKSQITKAISFVNGKLKDLEAETRQTGAVREGIAVLEDVKKILMGTI